VLLGSEAVSSRLNFFGGPRRLWAEPLYGMKGGRGGLVSKYLFASLALVLAFGAFGCSTPNECRARHSDDLRMAPVYRGELKYPDHVNDVRGAVSLHIKVERNGSVSRVLAIKSEPEGVFDETAVAYVSKWRYCPRLTQDADFPSPILVKLEFRPPS
jgi:TonB family protein